MTIEHELFDSMREDFDTAIGTLFKIMTDSRKNSGSLTLKLNVSLSPRDCVDPDTGELKHIQVPEIEHTVKIAVKHEGAIKGTSRGEYELTFGERGAELKDFDDGQFSMFKKQEGF